jgi:hypothetical protein
VCLPRPRLLVPQATTKAAMMILMILMILRRRRIGLQDASSWRR